LWMEFSWYMFTSFEMYFICFAFILCAVTQEIYFRNQLVFLKASRNETPVYNSVPMGSKKRHDSSLCDQQIRNNYSWFQTFTMFWVLYVFFWVFPWRQIVICRRFGTLCQFHFQRLGVEYEVWMVRGKRGIYTRAEVSSSWQDQWGVVGGQSGWVSVEGEV
jgi:hypothetical protein